MKKLTYTLTFLFFIFQGSSQNREIDSLLQILKVDKKDTNEVKAIQDLALIYLDIGNYDSANILYNQAMILAERLQYMKAVVTSYNGIGNMNYYQDNFSNAITNYYKALKISEKLNNKKSVATIYCNIGNVFRRQGKYSEALKQYTVSLKIREEIGDKRGIAICYNNIGLLYDYQGYFPEALKTYSIALKIQEEINDLRGVAVSYNDIGTIYDVQGNYPEALKNYFISLKIREKLGDKYGIAASYLNIGIIYFRQEHFSEALKNYFTALKLFEQIIDKQNITRSYICIGAVYSNQEKYTEALKYYYAALKIQDEIGDKIGIIDSYSNIGVVHFNNGNYSEALKNYFSSLKIAEEIGYRFNFPSAYNNIGRVYVRMNEASKGKQWLQKGLDIAKEMNDIDNKKEIYLGLSEADSILGNYKSAYINYKLYTVYKDSINNNENTKKTVQLSMQYEFNKKQTADSLKLAEERSISILKFEQEKKQRYFLYGGLILVVIFAGFIFNRFKVTQKQKIIIEAKERVTQQQNALISEQKKVIEERHKEVTDSINYAERIQRSMLATTKSLTENLTDHFVLFKPKDVVSGDFYWTSKLSNENFVLATADSTGHGVPGAIMSVVNMNSLKEAVKNGYTKPHEILNYTRNIIIETLKNDGTIEGGKDGMDCSLCVYDFKNLKLFVAAANNPVWIVRKVGDSNNELVESDAIQQHIYSNKQLIEIKPDKMPIGKHERQDISFTLHEIKLQKDDIIYSLTDGFPDQFGGEKGKKFMIKNLRELLVVNSCLPMLEQKKLLETTFANWVGDLEQVDDVTIIGVRI